MQPVFQRNHTSKPYQLGMSEIIVDARGIVLGRLASYVSKLLLEGKVVIVVNAEQAVITGRKRSIIERFKTRLGTRTLGSQKKAPKHPRRPDTYVRRVIRGMLPWKKPRGKKAYRRLKVHINIPDHLKDTTAYTFPDAMKNIHPSMDVGELMEIFGWRNPLEVNLRAP